MAINIKNSDSAIVLALGTLLNEDIIASDEVFKKDFFLTMSNIIVKFVWEEVDGLNKLIFVVSKQDSMENEDECLKIEMLSVDKKGKIILLTNEGYLSSLLYEAVEEDLPDDNNGQNRKVEEDNSFRVNIMSELGHIINLTMRDIKSKIS